MKKKTSYEMRGNPLNNFGGILAIILFLVVLFMLSRFVFRILYYLSPLMLIAALIINRKVVIDYGKWVISLYRRDLLLGVGGTVLTIIGFPIVSAFLLIKALFKKRLADVEEEIRRREQGQLIDYEELDSRRLGRRERERTRRSANEGDYEELFD